MSLKKEKTVFGAVEQRAGFHRNAASFGNASIRRILQAGKENTGSGLAFHGKMDRGNTEARSL